MKTKAQKGEELKKGKELLGKSEVLIFSDFTKISTENMRKLRNEARAAGAELLVIKKRLLQLLLKEAGANFDLKQFKSSVGTVFSTGNAEKISGPVYKFFSKLEVKDGEDKAMWVKHILGGYDLKKHSPLAADEVIYIGKLPPREVLLAQLLGMLAGPLRSFMYLLDQKSKQGGETAAGSSA